mmetsp:Transcript_4873/g.13581  ORF Transcript_4873/g.13581 Transcript_4873/m.13581 type:complete len:206 (+) Transcript_4873:157-774(+)
MSSRKASNSSRPPVILRRETRLPLTLIWTSKRWICSVTAWILRNGCTTAAISASKRSFTKSTSFFSNRLMSRAASSWSFRKLLGEMRSLSHRKPSMNSTTETTPSLSWSSHSNNSLRSCTLMVECSINCFVMSVHINIALNSSLDTSPEPSASTLRKRLCMACNAMPVCSSCAPASSYSSFSRAAIIFSLTTPVNTARRPQAVKM